MIAQGVKSKSRVGICKDRIGLLIKKPLKAGAALGSIVKIHLQGYGAYLQGRLKGGNRTFINLNRPGS